MIAQTASTFHTPGQAVAPMMGPTMSLRRTCAVQLFDRRTGSVHRINGAALIVFTRDPEAAVADLLEGRDPALWEVRVSDLETGRRT